MIIREGVFDDPQAIDLLTVHMAAMLAQSPVDECHFLDLGGLQAEGVAFYTLWDGETLAAMGALKIHDAGLGEIKSMRTAAPYLGTGRGRLMLAHIVGAARAKGLSRIALETGSGAAFDPAIALYRTHGFVACPPFGDYQETAFNRFMTLTL